MNHLFAILFTFLLGTNLTAGDFARFIHTAAKENIKSHLTVLDHPDINGQANKVLFVQAIAETGCSVPVGVLYDGEHWRIFNQDLSEMKAGTQFNVFAAKPSQHIKAHTATHFNTTDSMMVLKDLGFNQYLMPIVTQRFGAYNNSNIAVKFNYDKKQWELYNTNGQKIPHGTKFNILAYTEIHINPFDEKIMGAIFRNTAGKPVINSKAKKDERMIFLTQANFHTTVDQPALVKYNGKKWEITHPNNKNIPKKSMYHVLMLRENLIERDE